MRMEDTPYDAAMTRSKQELARQVVDCNARIEALEAALRTDHIIRVVLQAYGFTDDKLDDLTWLRGAHAYSIASKVAAALAPEQEK